MSSKGFRQGSPRIIGLQSWNRAGGVLPPGNGPRDPKKSVMHDPTQRVLPITKRDEQDDAYHEWQQDKDAQ